MTRIVVVVCLVLTLLVHKSLRILRYRRIYACIFFPGRALSKKKREKKTADAPFGKWHKRLAAALPPLLFRRHLPPDSSRTFRRYSLPRLVYERFLSCLSSHSWSSCHGHSKVTSNQLKYSTRKICNYLLENKFLGLGSLVSERRHDNENTLLATEFTFQYSQIRQNTLFSTVSMLQSSNVIRKMHILAPDRGLPYASPHHWNGTFRVTLLWWEEGRLSGDICLQNNFARKKDNVRV